MFYQQKSEAPKAVLVKDFFTSFLRDEQEKCFCAFLLALASGAKKKATWQAQPSRRGTVLAGMAVPTMARDCSDGFPSGTYQLKLYGSVGAARPLCGRRSLAGCSTGCPPRLRQEAASMMMHQRGVTSPRVADVALATAPEAAAELWELL